MNLPHKNWLKYMIGFVGSSVREAQEASTLYGLGEPSSEDLITLKEQLEESKPKCPMDIHYPPCKSWIRKQKIMSLARETKDAVKAREILSNRRLRRVVQLLLITETPFDAICVYAKEITGAKVKEPQLKLFKHYFWNTDDMTLNDWAEFLDQDVWSDRELYLNSRERGEEYALWKLGYRVEIPDNDLLSQMLHEAQSRFFETSGDSNTKDTAMKAKLWSEVVFKALEEKNKTGDAVKQVLDELKSIAIHLDHEKIPSLEDLSGGHHSEKGLTKSKKDQAE